MHRKETTTAIFLIVLAATALYFCYLIAKPFLSPIFLAFMIAIIFHPVHARIRSRVGGRNVAALISTTLVLVVVVVPAVGLVVVVSRDHGPIPVAEPEKCRTRRMESLCNARNGPTFRLAGAIREPSRARSAGSCTAMAGTNQPRVNLLKLISVYASGFGAMQECPRRLVTLSGAVRWE